QARRAVSLLHSGRRPGTPDAHAPELDGPPPFPSINGKAGFGLVERFDPLDVPRLRGEIVHRDEAGAAPLESARQTGHPGVDRVADPHRGYYLLSFFTRQPQAQPLFRARDEVPLRRAVQGPGPGVRQVLVTVLGAGRNRRAGT